MLSSVCPWTLTAPVRKECLHFDWWKMTCTSITKSRDLRWFCNGTVTAISFSYEAGWILFNYSHIYISNALHDFSMTPYVYISSFVSSRRHIIFKHNAQFTDKRVWQSYNCTMYKYPAKRFYIILTRFVQP